MKKFLLKFCTLIICIMMLFAEISSSLASSTANDENIIQKNVEEDETVTEVYTQYKGIGESIWKGLKSAFAELMERIFSTFILIIGLGVRGLISVVAGFELSIDNILFDRYKNTSLSFFKNDIGSSTRNSRESIIDSWSY